MRNLEILTRQVDTLNVLLPAETITHAEIDEYTKRLIVYTSKHRLMFLGVDSTLVAVCCLTDETPAVEGGELVLLSYVQELQGIQLVYTNGVMLVYKVETQTIDELGELPQGCLAAAWSPNQEFLAVASCKMMIVFTPEFDILHEHMLDDSDNTFTAEELMSDKKECQISEAAISWRGDSQIFVCTYLINGGRKCLTRDLTKNGQVTKGPARADNQVVFSVSEKPLPQLELPTCIMPNGSLVTGFQNRVLPNGKTQPEIIFWERNGLRHGEFALPVAQGASLQVRKLSYNCDSTLLGIHTTCSDGSEQVMIYTRSNWKWQCKQVVAMSDRIATFMWKDKYQIVVIGQSGQMKTTEYNFVFHSSMSSCNQGNDTNGYTIVVDGSLLNFTPLGKQLMPPPMFEKQVCLPSHPVCVSMFNSHTAALDLHNNLYHFNAQNIPTQLSPLMTLKYPLSFIQNFEYQDHCYLVGVLNHPTHDSIVLVNLTEAKLVKEIALEFKIQRVCLGAALVHNPRFESEECQTQNSIWLSSGQQGMLMGYQKEPEVCLVLQSSKRDIYKMEIDLANGQSDCELQFQLEFLAIGLKTCILTGKPVIVSLTSNLRLYINDKMLSNECTGFLLTQNFILFTNTTSGIMHELHIYDLNRQLPADHTKLPKPSPLGDFNVRAIERGSRLVCCPSSRLVMQMPRGNLEGIQPRIILCKQIVQLVKDTQYGKAFRLLRQHKADINMVYDVDPQLFLQNISKFVKEVSQVDYLNLFVNSLNGSDRGRELEFMFPLKDEDLVIQKHTELTQKFDFGLKKEKANKVNVICVALQKELERVDKDNNYLLPILTTYIKREPQELKQVLVKIQEMQRVEQALGLASRVVPPHLNPQTLKRDIDPATIKLGSKEALEFVSWLVQPNKLFDVALTTYDFYLVTLVASQTQKDPKEYVPYLQQLKALTNTDYMQFKIHYDLKNYEEALECIARSSEESHFEEALQLIKKQRLFKQALLCFRQDSGRLRRVNHAFAEYLEQRGYVEEAGFAYLTANDHKASLEAFSVALNVDMCLSVAAESGINGDDLQHMRDDLVTKLVAAGRYESAGDLVDPQTQYELALDCYLKAGNYQKAIKVSLLTRHDLAPVKQSAFFSYELKYNQLKTVLDTHIKRTLRLAIVQNTKRTMPMASVGTGNFELDSEQLSVSQQSESNKSKSIGFSETSKKSKRQNSAVTKMRKKRQVKEGSPYEEDYLIELIQQETQLQGSDKEQVKELMKMLLFFGYFDEAAVLHSLVANVIIAKYEAEVICSVDQERVMQEQPQLKEVLGLGRSDKRQEEHRRELQDWENSKSFKH